MILLTLHCAGSRGEAQEKVHKGPIGVIRHIVKERGVFGLAKVLLLIALLAPIVAHGTHARAPRTAHVQGMSATIYREMPAYAGQFMVYELVKRWLISLHNTDTYTGTAHDLSCACACAFSYLIEVTKLGVPLQQPTETTSTRWSCCWRAAWRASGRG
jgi:hypothetical protein